MNSNVEVKNEMASRKASPNMVQLALTLYEETGWNRRYSEKELFTLPFKDVMQHIDVLKNAKKTRANLGKNVAPMIGIDNPAYGLAFKLAVRMEYEQVVAIKPFSERVIATTCELYDLYQEAKKQVFCNINGGEAR